MATPDGTQQADVRFPMTSYSGGEGVRFCIAPGEFVYISAQNSNDSGSVTCTITVEGGRDIRKFIERGMTTCVGSA